MAKQEPGDGFIRCQSVENLMLMVVLGAGSVREQARTELGRRRAIRLPDEFEDMFMTNLSVV